MIKAHSIRLSLPLVFFLGIILFHVANWRHPNWKPNSRYSSFSQQWLHEMGKLARYRLGQLDSRVVSSEGDGLLHLYLRSEGLFFTEHYRSRIKKDFAPAASRWIKTLTSKGIKVVLVCIPPKLALSSRLPEHHKNGSAAYSVEKPGENLEFTKEVTRLAYQAATDFAPGTAVDLLSEFQKWKNRHPEDTLYIPADNHWTSLGQAIAAKAVLKKLSEMGVAVTAPELRQVAFNPPRFDFYLLRLLDLPDFFLKTSREFRWSDPLYQLEPPPSSEYSEANGRVVVVGTSFSLTEQPIGYSFAEMVAQGLHRKLRNVSVAGGRASGAIQNMKARREAFHRGDIVIWEVAMPIPLQAGESLGWTEVEDFVPSRVSAQRPHEATQLSLK